MNKTKEEKYENTRKETNRIEKKLETLRRRLWDRGCQISTKLANLKDWWLMMMIGQISWRKATR